MPTDQTMEQEFEAIPPKEEKPTRKIILAIGGLVIAVTVTISLLLFLVSRKPGERTLLPIIPSPTPIVTKAITRLASPYATDSAILKIEEDIKNLEGELQTTDLKEAGLNPPVLDMEVK